MLRYVRKYHILYYLLSVTPALVYTAMVFFTVGPSGFLSVWTWVATLALVVACSIVASRLMNRAADTEVKQVMKIFYEKCDPQLFLTNGREIASRIKVPFSEWGSLFMSAYGLAYADMGERDKAREVIEAMRVSAQANNRPSAAAHICLNMHAPIKVLYGADLALQCLGEAEGLLMQGENTGSFAGAKEYIIQERNFDIAEKLNDDDEIIRLYGEIQTNDRLFKRTRVMAAHFIAKAWRRKGDTAKEREMLEFVIEQGNKLPIVNEARNRLKENQTRA